MNPIAYPLDGPATPLSLFDPTKKDLAAQGKMYPDMGNRIAFAKKKAGM